VDESLLPFFFMSVFLNKRILIGITGGIAAYKIPFLVRLLLKQGAEVRIIMTADAQHFVTAETLSVLSKHPVLIDFFDKEHNWNNHVSLGEWADVFLIAPLTANTLAKMAAGICDNLLLATYYSARGTTIVAPAMDLEMYQHPTVKANLNQLAGYGNAIIPAEKGELASGLSGEGRMAEPEHIVNWLENYFLKRQPLNGLKVLINAGPTYEAIDPVRYIGNRSSGKMGVALASTFADKGAQVVLILGPSSITPSRNIQTIHVETAEEMMQQMLDHFEAADIVICSAAVADFKLENPSTQKIKKTSSHLTLELTKNPDILLSLGQIKKHQYLIGFALETENLLENAKDKLMRKKADLIIANEAGTIGTGIGSDTNQVYFVAPDNKIVKFELKDKGLIAQDLIQYLSEIGVIKT